MLDYIETILNGNYVYIGLFVLLFLNGLINIPSSQLVYLTFGYFLHTHPTLALMGIISGTLGNTLGNFTLYKIIRTSNQRIGKTLSRFISFDTNKIENFLAFTSKNRLLWLTFAKLIPSIKITVPIISGMLPISKTAAIIVFGVGSFLWAVMVTYIGYILGDKFNFGQISLIVLAVYLLLGAFTYVRFIKSKNL